MNQNQKLIKLLEELEFDVFYINHEMYLLEIQGDSDKGKVNLSFSLENRWIGNDPMSKTYEDLINDIFFEDKEELKLKVQDMLIDAEQNAIWTAKREKDDSDDEEILIEFFNDNSYLQYKTKSELEEFIELGQDQINERVQKLFFRIAEDEFTSDVEVPEDWEIDVTYEEEDVIDIFIKIDNQTWDEFEFNETPNLIARKIVMEIFNNGVDYWINHNSCNIYEVKRFLTDKEYSKSNWGGETKYYPERKAVTISYYV